MRLAQNQARGDMGTYLQAADRAFSKPKWGHPDSQKNRTRYKPLLVSCLGFEMSPMWSAWRVGLWVPLPYSPASGWGQGRRKCRVDHRTRSRALSNHGGSGKAPAGEWCAPGGGPPLRPVPRAAPPGVCPARGSPSLPRSHSPPRALPSSVRAAVSPSPSVRSTVRPRQ